MADRASIQFSPFRRLAHVTIQTDTNLPLTLFCAIQTSVHMLFLYFTNILVPVCKYTTIFAKYSKKKMSQNYQNDSQNSPSDGDFRIGMHICANFASEKFLTYNTDEGTDCGHIPAKDIF
ncbi:MAG: hypothetical protein J6T56_07390 [Bacteroidales bacterium]|nr:hypothetical protein [Bacteroidales bacterium]